MFLIKISKSLNVLIGKESLSNSPFDDTEEKVTCKPEIRGSATDPWPDSLKGGCDAGGAVWPSVPVA